MIYSVISHLIQIYHQKGIIKWINTIVIKWKWNNSFIFIIPDTNPYCNLNLIKFAKFCDILHYHNWILWFSPWVSASKKPYLKTQSRPRERVRKREEVMQMLCRQEKWQLKCPAEMLFDGESILVSVLDLSTFRRLHSHAYYCKEKLKTVLPDTYCTQKLYSYAH